MKSFKIFNIILLIFVILIIQLKCHFANYSDKNFDDFEILTIEDADEENLLSLSAEDLSTLKNNSRYKRDLLELEAGSGSPEPTLFSTDTSTVSSTTTTTTTTSSSSTTTIVTTSSTVLISINSTTSTKTTPFTSIASTSTSRVITSPTTRTNQTTRSNQTTITTRVITTPTTRTSVITTISTTTRRPSTTNKDAIENNTVECTYNNDCSFVYGASACDFGQCTCLPPTVLFNRFCRTAFPMFFNLVVYVPINIVCEILYGSSAFYRSNFEYVISHLLQRNPILSPVFMSVSVNILNFIGDRDMVTNQNVCPQSQARYYNFKSRFARAIDDFRDTSLQSKQYEQFLSYCNDTAQLNYDISSCWQKFNVDYTIFFSEAERNSSLSLDERKIKYKREVLENMIPVRDETLLLLRLNDSANLAKIYLDIKTQTGACDNYVNVNNITNPTVYTDCLDGKIDDHLLNDTKNNFIIEELKTEDFFIGVSCNIISRTCAFDTRRCIDTNIYGPICECQPGYYSPTGSYNTECVSLCSKKCLHNGRCTTRSNKEECVCSGYFFGDVCQFDGLAIIIVAAIVLFLSALLCTLLWICFVKRKSRKNKEKAEGKNKPVDEKNEVQRTGEAHKVEGIEHHEPEKKIQTLAAVKTPDENVLDFDWDVGSISKENDSWDEILGKINPDESANLEAYNPAYFRKRTSIESPTTANNNSNNKKSNRPQRITSPISLPGEIPDDDDYQSDEMTKSPRLRTINSDNFDNILGDDQNGIIEQARL